MEEAFTVTIIPTFCDLINSPVQKVNEIRYLCFSNYLLYIMCQCKYEKQHITTYP